MKGMKGLCVNVKAELDEMSPKVCVIVMASLIVPISCSVV